MAGEQKDQEQKPDSGLLTEDTSVVSGTDKATGAPVTRAKTPEDRADESVEPTDARERRT